jgi:hypothetical protein
MANHFTGEKNMSSPLGNTNFFKLMSSLDAENINPLRGDAIALQPNSLMQVIQAQSSSLARLGVDLNEFQKLCGSSLRELNTTWKQFISTQASIVLTSDMNKLVHLAEGAFDRKGVRTAEINSVINFILSYYDTVHRRSISKKEAIEGVLMRGLIKKSSFYQKIARADKLNDGTLTWDAASSESDDIWRHFILQTCRFLKHAVIEVDDLLDEDQEITDRLQAIINADEKEQFNQGKGRRSGWFLPLTLFAVGLGGLTLIPTPEQNTHYTQKQGVQNTSHTLTANIHQIQQAPVDVNGPTAPVNFPNK